MGPEKSLEQLQDELEHLDKLITELSVSVIPATVEKEYDKNGKHYPAHWYRIALPCQKR